MNIAHLQITRKCLFNNMVASLYDIHIHDQEPDHDFNLLSNFATAQGIAKLFKDGFTACIMPNHMDRIEHFVENEMPFIIVVTSDDEQSIIAAVNGGDVSY